MESQELCWAILSPLCWLSSAQIAAGGWGWAALLQPDPEEDLYGWQTGFGPVQQQLCWDTWRSCSSCRMQICRYVWIYEPASLMQLVRSSSLPGDLLPFLLSPPCSGSRCSQSIPVYPEFPCSCFVWCLSQWDAARCLYKHLQGKEKDLLLCPAAPWQPGNPLQRGWSLLGSPAPPLAAPRPKRWHFKICQAILKKASSVFKNASGKQMLELFFNLEGNC